MRGLTVYGTVILGEISFEDFFPFVGDRAPRREFTAGDGRVYSVKMTGHRCRLFARERACAACGLVGSRLFLDAAAERGSTDVEGRRHVHVNLYGEENGELVLMTKDHVVPVSLGGTNDPGNFRVLCAPCNSARANDTTLTLEQIRSRRLAPGTSRSERPRRKNKVEGTPISATFPASAPSPESLRQPAWRLLRSAGDLTAAFAVGDVERARRALAEAEELVQVLGATLENR